MATYISVPVHIWKEVVNFFRQIVSPCAECVRGNPVRCWQSGCAAFKFRPIARDVLSVSSRQGPILQLPSFVLVENEIIELLRQYGKPMLPSMLRLSTTKSKAVKSKTISRLVRKGRIIEQRVDEHTRLISLPTTKESK